jgi:Tfp pilus assembly protein PilE
MDRKAFTLVELLGIIVILGVIMLVAVPATINSYKVSRQKEAEAYILSLYSAAEIYLQTNIDAFGLLSSPGGRQDIPIRQLLEENYIRKLGTNPYTGSLISPTDTVVATKQANGTITYLLEERNTDIKNYVQPGLVLHYDSRINFGIGYDSSTNLFNDLTAFRRSATLNNFNNNSSSGFNNGYLRFDGANDFLQVSNNINLSTVWTIEVHLNYTNQSKTYEFLMGTTDTSGAFGKLLLRHNGNISYSYPAGTYHSLGVTSASISGSRRTLSFVSNGTNVVLFVNGVQSGTASVPNAQMIIRIIGNSFSDNSWLSRFDLYSLRAYDVALNSAQINSNYQIDVERHR